VQGTVKEIFITIATTRSHGQSPLNSGANSPTGGVTLRNLTDINIELSETRMEYKVMMVMMMMMMIGMMMMMTATTHSP
jgi:hypothetical protein